MSRHRSNKNAKHRKSPPTRRKQASRRSAPSRACLRDQLRREQQPGESYAAQHTRVLLDVAEEKADPATGQQCVDFLSELYVAFGTLGPVVPLFWNRPGESDQHRLDGTDEEFASLVDNKPPESKADEHRDFIQERACEIDDAQGSMGRLSLFIEIMRDPHGTPHYVDASLEWSPDQEWTRVLDASVEDLEEIVWYGDEDDLWLLYEDVESSLTSITKNFWHQRRCDVILDFEGDFFPLRRTGFNSILASPFSLQYTINECLVPPAPQALWEARRCLATDTEYMLRRFSIVRLA